MFRPTPDWEDLSIDLIQLFFFLDVTKYNTSTASQRAEPDTQRGRE